MKTRVAQTSLEAFDKIKIVGKEQAKVVYAAIIKHESITNKQLYQKLLSYNDKRISYAAICARTNALKHAGLIVEDGRHKGSALLRPRTSEDKPYKPKPTLLEKENVKLRKELHSCRIEIYDMSKENLKLKEANKYMTDMSTQGKLFK